MILRLNIRPFEFTTVLFLAFALLFPTVMQFSHIFENHEHNICSEADSHIHEAPVDCSFQDYQMASFTFEPIRPFEIGQIAIPRELGITSQQYFHTTLLYTNSLRGPPQYT